MNFFYYYYSSAHHLVVLVKSRKTRLGFFSIVALSYDSTACSFSVSYTYFIRLFLYGQRTNRHLVLSSWFKAGWPALVNPGTQQDTMSFCAVVIVIALTKRQVLFERV